MRNPPPIPPLSEFSRHPINREWLYAIHDLDEAEDPYQLRVTLQCPRRRPGYTWHVWVADRQLTRIAEIAKRIDELESSLKADRRAIVPDARQAAMF